MNPRSKFGTAVCAMGALVATLCTAAASRPVGEKPNIVLIMADDGSFWQCLAFPSVPGVLYQVQSSNDLRTWTTDTTIHGLGHEIVVPMFETDPPPPVPPSPPPGSLPTPAPPSPSAFLSVRPVTGGGIEIGWRSPESGSAARHHFPLLSLDAAWDLTPLFCNLHGNHHFLIFRSHGTVASAVINELRGPLDQAMLDDFETHWPAMNAAVATAMAASAHATPAPPASGNRRFWRIRADWSIDSDLDFTPDWAEFAGMAAAGTGADLSYDALSADADNSGTLDGEERSRDGDDIPDAFDAAPDDIGVDWEKVLPWRYAVFSAGTRTEPDSFPMPPLQINDQGTVLYPLGTWQAGTYADLSLAKPDEIDICRAMGMNDLGVIVGIGQPLREPQSTPGNTGQGSSGPMPISLAVTTFPVSVAWWQSRESDPIPVEIPNHFAEPVWFEAPEMPYFPHDKLIANDGRFIAWRSGEESPFPRIDATWNRIGNQFSETTVAGAPEGFKPAFVTDTLLTWGPQEGGTLLINAGNEISFGSWYPRFAETASQRIAAVANETRIKTPALAAIAALPSGWAPSPSLEKLVDLAQSGVGIRSDRKVWMNGNVTPLNELAPDLPEAWQSPQLRDISPSGWILADREAGSSTEGLVGMPLVTSPVFSGGAEGVDDFSIRSPQGSFKLGIPPDSPPDTDASMIPDPAVAHRAWVMVPQGHSKDFRLISKASVTNPLTLTFTGATSNGSNEVTVTLPDVLIPITGNLDEESGTDHTVDIQLGNEPSLSKPIGIKIMKRRTIRVAAYRIALQTANGGIISPDLTPTEAEITTRLNAVFLPQINADFDVRLAPDTLNVAFDLNQDDALTGDPGDAIGEYAALDNAVTGYRTTHPFANQASGNP